MNDINDNEKHFCKECNVFEYNVKNKSILLGLHIKQVHPEMTYVQYYIKHELGGVHPICAADDCNNELKYTSTGFKKYCCRSCANRGKNNPMSGKTGVLSPFYNVSRTPETIKNVVEGKRVAKEQRVQVK